jgi:hypothetical protein
MFRLMIECVIEAGAIKRGQPPMNSQRSGWRAGHVWNSAIVRGQSSWGAALAMILLGLSPAIITQSRGRCRVGARLCALRLFNLW